MSLFLGGVCGTEIFEVANIDGGNNCFDCGLELKDNYLYYNHYDNGLIVYNVSDTDNINIVDTFAYQDDMGGMSFINGDYLYTSNYNSKRFGIYDISDPTNVVKKVSQYVDDCNVNDINVRDEKLYITCANQNRFWIWNVSSKTFPVSYYNSAGTSWFYNVRYPTIDDEGNFVYVSTSSGLTIRNISSGSLSKITSILYSYDLDYENGFLYQLTSESPYSLRKYDVSNPLSPTLNASVSVRARFVVVQGYFGFVSSYDDSKLYVVDLRSMQIVDEVSLGYVGLGRLVVDGDYLYIRANTNVKVYDVSYYNKPVIKPQVQDFYNEKNITIGVNTSYPTNIFYSLDNNDLRNDGTVNGGVTIEDGAMVFDGNTGSYIEIPSILADNSDFSMIVKVNINSFKDSGGLAYTTGFFDKDLVQFGLRGLSDNVMNDLYFRVGNTIVTFYNVNVNTDYIIGATYNYTEGRLRLYLNGTLVREEVSSPQNHTASVMGIGRNYYNTGASQSYLDVVVDFALLYSVELTQEEITQIYQEGKDAYSPISEGLMGQWSGRDYEGTVSAPTTIYDTGKLTNLCQNCSQTELSLYNLDEIYHNITFWAKGISETLGFTVDATNPIINFTNQTEINNGYTFNISELNISCIDNNLKNCSIVFDDNSSFWSSNSTIEGEKTFNESGNHTFTITATDNAKNQVSKRGQLFLNPYLTFFFKSPNNETIYNYTFNNINYFNQTKLKMYDFIMGYNNLSFEKKGFQTKNIEFNLTNSTTELKKTYQIKIALLNLKIKNKDNRNYINQNVDIDLIGDDFAGTFSTSNGTITIYNITTLPDTYQLIFKSNDYEELTYYFTHTGFAEVNLNLFLQNSTNTIPIKYVVRDGFGNYISNAKVKLSEYYIEDNSYLLTTMGETNSNGEVIFNLDTTKYIKPQVLYDGQTTNFDGEKITTTPIYLTIKDQQLELFAKIPQISSRIEYTQLDNTTGRFTFTFSDENNIIERACLNLTKITFQSSNNISSKCIEISTGSINIDFETSHGFTYVADGYVTYQGEEMKIKSYSKKIVQYSFSWGIWGILFAIMVIPGLAIAGFFMGKAKGILIGATVGLWIVAFPSFEVWSFSGTSLTVWSVLLLIGVMFS